MAWRDRARNARASRITIGGARCGCRRIDAKCSRLILARRTSSLRRQRHFGCDGGFRHGRV